LRRQLTFEPYWVFSHIGASIKWHITVVEHVNP
jgi:hypothetical protein